MPGLRSTTYRGDMMLVTILKTTAIVCHLLCQLHVLMIPMAVALHTTHRKPHLNDTAIARSPADAELTSFRTHDSHAIHYYMTHACEREQLHISCEKDYVILIVRANYGRHSTKPCAKATKKRHTICPGSFVHPKKVVARACTGSRSCRISVISRLFGDPCPKVSKYLEVYFGCIREETSANDDYNS